MEGLPNKASISQYLPLISADEEPQGHRKAEAPHYRDLNIRIDSLIVRTENIDEYGFRCGIVNFHCDLAKSCFRLKL